MRIIAALLRRNPAPAEVMLVLAAEEAHMQKAFAKAGRNEPCPCGSGRTFKQCHGLYMTLLCKSTSYSHESRQQNLQIYPPIYPLWGMVFSSVINYTHYCTNMCSQ
jgi:hypothetical protein